MKYVEKISYFVRPYFNICCIFRCYVIITIIIIIFFFTLDGEILAQNHVFQ